MSLPHSLSLTHTHNKVHQNDCAVASHRTKTISAVSEKTLRPVGWEIIFFKHLFILYKLYIQRNGPRNRLSEQKDGRNRCIHPKYRPILNWLRVSRYEKWFITSSITAKCYVFNQHHNIWSAERDCLCEQNRGFSLSSVFLVLTVGGPRAVHCTQTTSGIYKSSTMGKSSVLHIYWCQTEQNECKFMILIFKKSQTLLWMKHFVWVVINNVATCQPDGSVTFCHTEVTEMCGV